MPYDMTADWVLMPFDGINCIPLRNFASGFATFAVLLGLQDLTAKYAKGSQSAQSKLH